MLFRMRHMCRKHMLLRSVSYKNNTAAYVTAPGDPDSVQCVEASHLALESASPALIEGDSMHKTYVSTEKAKMSEVKLRPFGSTPDITAQY